MRIAGVDRPLVLSPMVDVTDAAFRSIAAAWGAQITCSEMVSAAGLVHGNTTTHALIQPWPDGESPYGVQIMGGEPQLMADAVRVVLDTVAPDFIDLNLGCPSPNILRSCAGGFLLRDPAHAGTVIAAAVDAAGDTPVSVKMRTGPDADHLTYLDVGAQAQAAGAAWCTLHGRSVAQAYQGEADWSTIGRLVDLLDIPVVGNGDLRSPDDVVHMQQSTGCAGFFIARAAMHDPTVFRRMRQALDGQTPEPGPGLAERLQIFQDYLERARRIGIDHVAVLRRQGTRFVSGAPGAKALRAALHTAQTAADVQAVLDGAIRSPAV